jgi:3-phenylpropionate/trans-cinnamate dioxygenase ferredoxin reductase subunit
MHRSNGVRLLAEAKVAAFEGAGRLEAVVTAGGGRVACDFVVAGIGIDPDMPAVVGSSIVQENGILADERCRTSAADVGGR